MCSTWVRKMPGRGPQPEPLVQAGDGHGDPAVRVERLGGPAEPRDPCVRGLLDSLLDVKPEGLLPCFRPASPAAGGQTQHLTPPGEAIGKRSARPVESYTRAHAWE